VFEQREKNSELLQPKSTNTSSVKPCCVGHMWDTRIGHDRSIFFVISRIYCV